MMVEEEPSPHHAREQVLQYTRNNRPKGTGLIAIDNDGVVVEFSEVGWCELLPVRGSMTLMLMILILVVAWH